MKLRSSGNALGKAAVDCFVVPPRSDVVGSFLYVVLGFDDIDGTSLEFYHHSSDVFA